MKNQVKKSLSLIMAVIMLMSCWVWVAPQKAEAGEKTQYYMKITTNVNDTGNENGSTITINYKDTNGKGDTGTFTQSYGQQGWNGQVTVYEGPIDGWPTSFSWKFDLGYGRSENHRDITVWIGGSAETCTHKIAYSTGYKFEYTVFGKKNLECKMNITGTAPYFNEVTSIEAGSATLNKLPDGADASTTVKVTRGKDQYGVDWKASLPTSGFSYAFKYTDDSGVEKDLGTSEISTTSTSNSATVYLKNSLQKLFPGKQNGQVQAYCSYNSSKAGATIKADFPTYKATFDSNGGLIGDDSSSAKAQVEVTNDNMNYDTLIGKAPAYAAKDGFDFKGYYSSKNSDATGKTASFSGTKFEDNVTKVPATGDTTWYAAWQALPITATFVTQDRQLIGTVEGRYNNSFTASNMYNGLSGLNAAVKASHTAGKVKFNGNNEPIYKDGSTTFIFDGWQIIKAYDESVMDKDEDTVLKGDVTFIATYTSPSAETYTVKFKNAAGEVISTQSGYKYRDDVTNIPKTEPTKATNDRYEYKFIGWAKDIGKNFYTVDENDKNEDGATVVYTAKDGASFVVKGDASYVPVFRMVPREYKVTYNYTGDNKAPMSTSIKGYHWAEGVKMPEIKDNYTADGFRYYLTGWKIDNEGAVKQLDEIMVEGDMSLTAVYGNREAAKYTINFYGKDVDGETNKHLNADSNIYDHGSTVTVPDVPQIIDTEDALYTFASWSPAVNTTAGGDVDYYATYTKKTYADIHFYNYDGTLIYELDGKENGLFVGETIPAFNDATPIKAEDPVGTYNFTGWKDGDGNVVVPGTDKFTGDVYLTAQFETVYKEYTVKFVNEGNTVSETPYRYGDEITVPKNPTKEADVAYVYDFRAWSPDVSEVCYGDATYTATYRRTPQYYKVTWLNDAKAVHTESNYQYNAKIQQAVISNPVILDSAGVGKTWAFKHWVQCDASGNDILDADDKQIIFVRGQRMGSEHLYFYPVFEAVDNILTVKFYEEDGTSFLGEAKIPYGANLLDYADAFAEKAPKAADETNHYVINEWVNVNGGARVETITADVSVKATYTQEAHTKDVYDITLEPTCTETGLADISCSATECGYIFKNVVLDVIPDEGIPTGQIYVGQNKWTLDNFTSGIDYDDVRFVNPGTYVVVNADDLGSRSRNNPDGILNRGVGKIDYYISETKVNDPSAIGTWTNVYDYKAVEAQVLSEVLTEKGKTTQDYIAMSTPGNKEKKAIDDEVKAILSAYHANATGVLSNLNLVNGKNYIIYIRVSDREVNGQSNKCYFSSGKISYGSNSAEIAVSGEGYGAKFCAKAEITVTDDYGGCKVYLDDNEVTLTDNKFTCSTAGVHKITVVDKHGNTSVKTFEIKGAHSYRSYTINASCVNVGSKYDICTVCGAKANETTIPARGHSYTASFVDKAPDCINDGYRTYVCDNNCGTKLVLNLTDSAETLAQAKKKANAEAEDYTVALTADDLKHLKATGKHTYAMVKDADGNDTAEYVWVIDKEATCMVEGSKHRDCTICGIATARKTEVIPVDRENGHKFYRAKVTLEPTCTTAGEKTRACKYDGCDHVEVVKVLPALGHTEGEYRTVTAATCEVAGSKILTCSVCNVDIGEPIKDGTGKVTDFNGKAVEISALGHSWKIVGDIYQDSDDSKWYQNKVCRHDASHTTREEVEGYKPPVAATVTFNIGETVLQTIEGHVGDTISAADVTAKPKKAANATYSYTFSHWADDKGNEVKFPIEVKGDATYTAVFAERYINYTITYYREGTPLTEYKKTGYLHNGEAVELAAGPAKAGDWEYTYKFAGWAMDVDKIGEDGSKVLDENGNPVKERKVIDGNTVTINAANINLYATYDAIRNIYAVTYAYSSNNIIHTYLVAAGSCAPAAEKDFGEITKEYDSKYHYEFNKWNKDAEQFAVVKSNIYTTPEFDAIKHDYNKALKTPATCTTDAEYTNTCSCGRTYDSFEANTALGHLWGEPVYNAETGKSVITCQREGCNATEEDTRTFTVKFYKKETDTEAIKNISYIPWGSTIEADVPDAPVKESTATTDYTFKGWAIKGTTAAAGIDFSKLEIKQDYEFVAMFTETTRLYNVIFVNESAADVIETYKDVPAGTGVTFAGTTVPTKARDDKYHYTFKGWKGYDEGVLNITVENVQERVIVYAEYNKLEHTYDAGVAVEAEKCGEYSGVKYTCTAPGCGYSYVQSSSKPLGHVWVADEHKDPTPDEQGYTTYKCSVCGAPGTTEYHDYEDNKVSVIVTVYRDGALASNIKVITQVLGESEAKTATTNKNGVATIDVVKGKTYVAWVEVDGNKIPVTLVEDAKGNFVGTYNIETSNNNSGAACGCACHRNNFWGAIFRFFHKIIKLFTGEFKCCGNPDPMYG